MTSKSIHTISSYTVSKLRRFFWDTVYFHQLQRGIIEQNKISNVSDFNNNNQTIN